MLAAIDTDERQKKSTSWSMLKLRDFVWQRNILMAQPGKYRFRVSVDGVDVNLFSIEERKGGKSAGDLIISFPPAGYYEDGFSGKLEKVIEDRISVHLSPSSKGNTVVFHQKTADNYYKSASYVEFNDQDTFWLMYTGARSRPEIGEAAPPKPKDIINVLASYEHMEGTFAYTIWLTKLGVQEIPAGRYQSRIDFANFSIHVVYHQLAVFSIFEGFRSTSATSPRLVNDVPDDIPPATTFEAHNIIEAALVNLHAMERLSSRLFRSHIRFANNLGIKPTDVQLNDMKLRCCTAVEIDLGIRLVHPFRYLIASPYSSAFDDDRTTAYVKFGDI